MAVAFGRAGYRVIGFDINAERIAELRRGQDRTREIEMADLHAARIEYTDQPGDLAAADFFIVTVPT